MRIILGFIFLLLIKQHFSQILLEQGDTVKYTQDVKKEFIYYRIDGKVIKDSGEKYFVFNKVKNSSLFKIVTSEDLENINLRILDDLKKISNKVTNFLYFFESDEGVIMYFNGINKVISLKLYLYSSSRQNKILNVILIRKLKILIF